MVKSTQLPFISILLHLLNSTMTSTIRNYFQAFYIWHHYLEGSSTSIDVVTNQKDLEYFSTMKLLICRQACWSEYLSSFHFVLCFCPSKVEAKPDSLTRR